MSGKSYVFGDLYDLGNVIGHAEDFPEHEPKLSFSDARAQYEQDLVRRINDLQHELVKARNLVEADLNG